MMIERIPNFTALRRKKAGYDRRYLIDTVHPLHNDPLVDVRLPPYNFNDAESYYARPNALTGKVLPGVPNKPLVRQDVARRLMLAEHFLQSDREVRELLGANAHLQIMDALRPYEVQRYAFEVAWPAAIAQAHPEMTADEVTAEVPKYHAKPHTTQTPTPHLTGAAVDVRLINIETGKPFNRGHISGSVSGTAYPDYYELYQVKLGESDIEYRDDTDIESKDLAEIVASRRVLFHAMVVVAGLSVNPHEIWHYGIGDPLSEYVAGGEHPYYGVIEVPK